MDKTKSKILIIVLAVISVILFSLNITLALMSDRKVDTGIVQFDQHKLDIEIIGNETIVLTPEELTLGSKNTRKINISNPSNSTPCVLRIWLEFNIDNQLNTEYLNFYLNENEFVKSENNVFYYKNVLNSGARLNNLVLNFEVNTISQNYEGKSYSLKLNIESIQSNKTAVEIWNNDYPVDWYNNIKNKLS